jgi:phospholipase/carboxylesterase
MLDLGSGRPVRYVFPNAPIRPVTINNGMRMRAWYDLETLSEEWHQEDGPGIRASAARIDALVAREVGRGIAERRIVLAGFSQGAAVALHTGLRHRAGLAGLIVLSGYLPLAESLVAEASEANRKTPIFMGHGEVDQVVPISMARRSFQQLNKLGYAVTWKTYLMPHSVVDEELGDVRAFLGTVL